MLYLNFGSKMQSNTEGIHLAIPQRILRKVNGYSEARQNLSVHFIVKAL